MKQRFQSITLLVVSSLFLLASMHHFISCQVSKNFADVIDAATSQYTQTKEWQDTLAKNNIFVKIPTCQKVSFPPTFNFNRTYMNLCYDYEAFEPWITIHKSSGVFLLDTIKKQYNIPVLNPVYKTYPTDDGYFSTMKKGVDSGECDVIVGATNWNAERLAQAHFQCAYGTSYQGWLRSELQNETLIFKDIQDLDAVGVIVVVSADTSYENFVKSTFKKATIKVIGGYDDAWAMISNRTAHAYIADVLDLFIWVGNNRNVCPGCKVSFFGDSTQFGTFITSNIVGTSSGNISFEWNVQLTFISMIIFIVSFVLHLG